VNDYELPGYAAWLSEPPDSEPEEIADGADDYEMFGPDR